MNGWTPTFGVQLTGHDARVRISAPRASEVDLLVAGRPPLPLFRDGGQHFTGTIAEAYDGLRYQLRVDGQGPWPDPWSRFQPDGVHGPSAIVDPHAFGWSDAAWSGVPRHALVCYELHVGTFTTEGTFAAATARLPDLADLGITAVELMPVAAFPGTRNWGYDGAALFAPSEQYGSPDDLRALVDRAHALGIAVLLDVVYNHLGPDGAYLAAVMPTIFTDRHTSPWGRGINLDDDDAADVRRLICDNALQWLIEYHMDGLRIDATHALSDGSEEHVLAQLAREVSMYVTGRHVHLIAEDERNLASLVQPHDLRGTGLTGVWADDFHHAVRRHLAGDHEAWFRDFAGTADEIAKAVTDGWVFQGQPAVHYGGARGTSPADIPLEAAVICLQNHDQVGNRALGERLHHQIDVDRWLAASALLLTAPETPLLFMGQEWAASTPFLFFTDHHADLGARVVEGRRAEFARFSAFGDPARRAAIPDPQAIETWHASRLRWDERETVMHAHVLAETRALIAARHAHISGAPRDRARIRCVAQDSGVIVLTQPSTQSGWLVTVVSFDGAAPTPVPLPGRRPASLSLVHATSSAAPIVSGARLDAGGIVIDARPRPFGAVVHVSEISS